VGDLDLTVMGAGKDIAGMDDMTDDTARVGSER
jgi:hypothetical protein